MIQMKVRRIGSFGKQENRFEEVPVIRLKNSCHAEHYSSAGEIQGTRKSILDKMWFVLFTRLLQSVIRSASRVVDVGKR